MLRLIIIIAFVSVSVTEGLLVTVNQGTLNGTYVEARNGKLFNAFYGIPFAKPPVGELRFKAPVAADPWDGIFDATQTPVGCIELADDGNGTKGGEDCLNLNVFTPLGAREGDNLSVLFYLYGGIFKSNNNMDHGPQYMMTRNLIIVIPNYRSGPLGFLSTGDTVIPGNFGLKDQLLALKWTRENIHNFGGNPNYITMNGHSSGAVSAHFHTLSPSSKGLFQQVIIQSGSGFCSLSYWGPDVARAIAKEFAIKAGCPSVASSQDMYECFMNLNADLFVTVPEQMYVLWDTYPDAPFRPTIEDKNVEDAFITDIPNHLSYQSPELPWMIGLTTGEGAGTVSALLENQGEKAAILNKFTKILLPILLQYLWNTKAKHMDYVSEILKTHYFGEKDMSLQTAHQLVQESFCPCLEDDVEKCDGRFLLITILDQNTYIGTITRRITRVKMKLRISMVF
ncbi:esterase FE4-like isoform X2 [Planococcus citri]|uniref:esterase FE4-like isoform X2 n=1 Tax=Planococcus citri TaxID=170843 RepID=UPI0031F93C79